MEIRWSTALRERRMLGLVLLVAMNFRRLAGTSAVAGPIVFSAAWLVAWAVQDDYSPRHEDISALAALDAQQPWIMVTGFLALGLGTALLGLGLGSKSALAGGFSALAGALLVTVAGVGILVAGLARNDCSSELSACVAKVDAETFHGTTNSMTLSVSWSSSRSSQLSSSLHELSAETHAGRICARTRS